MASSSFSSFLDYLLLLTKKEGRKSYIQLLPPDYANRVLERVGILPDTIENVSFKSSEILALKISLYCSLSIRRNKPIYDSRFYGFTEKDCLKILKGMTGKGEKIRTFDQKSLSSLFLENDVIHKFLVKLEEA